MCCRSDRAVIGQDVLISPEGNKLVPKRPSRIFVLFCWVLELFCYTKLGSGFSYRRSAQLANACALSRLTKQLRDWALTQNYI